MHTLKVFIALVVGLSTMSCSTSKLVTPAVTYQSVRLVNPKNHGQSNNAEILLNISINAEGYITGTIFNMTSELMIIDQTKSFFIDSNGLSISYYDPTVQAQTVTDIASGTKGASVNLGAIGSAIGVGGAAGKILNSINIGSSSTNGQAVANTIYKADQPMVSIGPKGSLQLSKAYQISGIGKSALMQSQIGNYQFSSPEESPIRFSICITYSVDGGQTFNKITTDMYLNSQITVSVQNPRQINQYMRELLTSKRDAINEPWWMIYIPNNITKHKVYDFYTQGSLLDFQ